MAKLTKLPSLDIIRGFKGVIDFYQWKGIPCARAWPRFRPQNWTAPSRASAALFGLIIKAWALTGAAAKDLYTQDAADQPRHARDIYVSAVLGHLHEASMTDFLTLLTECRDFLSNLTALLNALNSVGTDQLDVIVQASALPTGAATAAAQATQLTALQKIDDLQNALQSLGTDRILIRGQDQVFSLKDTLEKWAMFVETADQWWVATPPVLPQNSGSSPPPSNAMTPPQPQKPNSADDPAPSPTPSTPPPKPSP